MAEPTGPGTAAPVPHAGPNAPRDASHWAAKVDRLRVEAREGVRGSNVAGKRLTGPVQGFGKMWQKTYSVDVDPGISPEDAIAIWKAHFPEFWPNGNRFAGALTGISPGDVALLDIAVGGGVKLSTGVFVLYADAESFTFATPEGHQFAAWITFSAERSSDATVVQTQVLLRAGDPLYELGMPLMHRMEDRFWVQTMIALGKRLGVADPAIQTRTVCVDPKRQWRRAGNVWQNSMARSVLQTVIPPLAGKSRLATPETDSRPHRVGRRLGGRAGPSPGSTIMPTKKSSWITPRPRTSAGRGWTMSPTLSPWIAPNSARCWSPPGSARLPSMR